MEINKTLCYNVKMKKLREIFKFFDKLEDKIRGKLSHFPILYAFVGSVGIILIWRGIWAIADEINLSSWFSLGLGLFITVSTGLFVSFFIGDRIIISGINKEKRIDEKTEIEIKEEEMVLTKIEKDLKEIKKEIAEI